MEKAVQAEERERQAKEQALQAKEQERLAKEQAFQQNAALLEEIERLKKLMGH
ncbi:MAG: hypothetical protein KDK45_23200 [Leptospiraceae bacterium]|nr:hypothetical protein [Leptospiraceae bacterium]